MILKNEDFNNREALAVMFHQSAKEMSASNPNIWEQVHVALGVSAYDPKTDRTVIDTVHKADEIMYKNKRKGKAEKKDS